MIGKFIESIRPVCDNNNDTDGGLLWFEVVHAYHSVIPSLIERQINSVDLYPGSR